VKTSSDARPPRSRRRMRPPVWSPASSSTAPSLGAGFDASVAAVPDVERSSRVPHPQGQPHFAWTPSSWVFSWRFLAIVATPGLTPARSPRGAPSRYSPEGAGGRRKSGTPLALAVFPWSGLAWRVAFWCAPLPVWGLFVLPVAAAATRWWCGQPRWVCGCGDDDASPVCGCGVSVLAQAHGYG